MDADHPFRGSIFHADLHHIARCLAILDAWDGDAEAEDDIDAEAETDCDLSDDEPMFPHRDLLRLQLAQAGCL